MALATLVVSVACGDDDITSTTTTSTSSSTTTPSTSSTTTTTVPAPLVQPAVWPAPDVVVASPVDAARDFVQNVLGVPPELGEFRQGDQRSGEIEVFVSTEGGQVSPMRWPRAVLFLRQLGPDDGWFVIGAATEHVTIEQPAVGATLTPGRVIVEGVGRGFEATMVVTAFLQGRAEPLDQRVTFAGSLDIAQPYRVELDLSDAPPGAVVAVLVRGGVGLETDPGEFTVVPYRVMS